MNDLQDQYNRQGSVVQSKETNKKYTKRLVFVFIVLVAVLIFTIAFQADFKVQQKGQAQREPPIRTGDENQFASFLMNLQRQANVRRPTPPPPVVVEPATPVTPAEQVVIHVPDSPRENVIRAIIVKREQPQRYYSTQTDASAASMLRELKTNAILGNPEVKNFIRDGDRANQASQASVGQDMTIRAVNDVQQMPDFTAMLASMQDQGGIAGGGNALTNPSGVRQKENFLWASSGGSSRTPQGYSTNIPIPQQFRWELKAGTVIPAILMNGIDSSLPGVIRAQVSENIWDTAFGSHVLIPKGSMITGVYNSDVQFGDRRVMMVWNRIVFPNGMTLNIAGSPGADQAGYSGLSGRVNEHWDKMFMAALISSIFVAGAQVVYEDNSSTTNITGNNNTSPRDAAAEQLANEMLRAGSRVMEKASQIPPTIRIRPGKRMAVFVQEDVVFPFPYPMAY